MNRFLSLVKINIKTSWRRAMQSGKKKERGLLGKIGIIALVILVFLSLGFSFGNMSYALTKQFSALGMGKMATGTMAISLNVLLLFFGIISIPTIMFFSKETELYMTMPFSPAEIFGANLVSMYLNQMIYMLLVSVPIVVGSLMAVFSIKALIGWMVIILTMPLFMVALIALLFLIVLQVAPGLRDKGKISLFTGIFSMIFGIAIYFSMQFINNEALSQSTMFIPIDEHSMNIISLAIPTIRGAMLMINGSGIISFLTGLSIVVIFTTLLVLLLLTLARPMYFRIILSMSEGGKKEKVLTKSQIGKNINTKNSPMLALIKREWKTMFRTPAYFLNVVVETLFIPLWIPFCFAVPFFLNKDELMKEGFSFSLLPEFVNDVFLTSNSRAIAIAILVGAAIAFLSFTGGPTATAVSREGKHIEFLKTLPMKARNTFIGIFAGSFILAFAVGLIMLIAVNWLSSFRLDILLMSILSFTVSSLGLALLEFNIDMISPSLDWEDETKAVKSNKNAIFASFLPMILAGISVFLIIKMGIGIETVSYIILGVLTLIMVLSFLNIWLKAENYLLRMNV